MKLRYAVLMVGLLLMTMPLMGACSTKPVPAKVASRVIVAQTPTPTPPALSSITGVPPKIPHSTKLRFECLLCHGQKGDTEIPFPDSHIGLTQDKCPICHQSAVDQAK